MTIKLKQYFEHKQKIYVKLDKTLILVHISVFSSSVGLNHYEFKHFSIHFETAM